MKDTDVYSIEMPEGWKRVDASVSGVQNTIMMSPAIDGNFDANINVLARPSSETLSEYFARGLKIFRTSEQFSINEIGDTIINGLQAKWVSIDIREDDLERTGISYFFQKKDIVYGISCVCNKNMKDKYYPIFKATTGTFKAL